MKIMDKFEKILDVIDHQEKYSDEEIREILKDEECRKLYQTMQEVDSALLEQTADGADIDAEWERFSEKHLNRALEKKSWRKMAASIAGFLLISCIAFAAIHTYIHKRQESMPIAETTGQTVKYTIKGDTVKATCKVEADKPAVHKIFENVAFSQMMSEIAAYYGLQLRFMSDETKSLRLYYEWDSHRTIENVVKELDQFDNVDVVLQGNEMIVK